ncbi:hypothetical protein D3C86_1248190 [compost metagenome]
MSPTLPRLQMPDFAPELAQYLAPRVKRLGYLGELFQVAGHAPQVLLGFMQFTDALKAALPDNLAETAVLTTATLMQNAYERNQHERLCVRTGLSRDWIRDVERLEPDAPSLLSDDERAVQRYAIAAVETRGLQAQAAFEDVTRRLPAQEAVAIAMLIGRYITHAIMVNTLRLPPPVPSIWEDGFGADTPAHSPSL